MLMSDPHWGDNVEVSQTRDVSPRPGKVRHAALQADDFLLCFAQGS